LIDTLEPRRLLSVSLSTNTNIGTLNGRSSFSDSLSSSNTQDIRKLTLGASASLKIVLSNLTANADIQLIKDSNGSLVVDSGETLSTAASTGTTTDTINKSGLSAGTYYVRVFESGTSSLNYKLTLTADYAGNSLGSARNIGTLSTATATSRDFVGSDDTQDFYKVTLTATKPFTATLSGLAANEDLQLIQDKNSNGIIDSGETITTSSKTGTSGETISKPLTAGTWYFRVFRPSTGGDSNYSLSLSPVGHTKIVFNYNFDASGFFAAHPSAKDRLNDAAATYGILLDNLGSITPGSGNTWTEVFSNPGTSGGPEVTLNNPTVASNTLVIYVGGRSDLSGSELGEGGPGGWSASGTSSWLNTVKTRGQSGVNSSPVADFAPWGGMISFKSTANWNFNSTSPTSTQNDFFSVALHELGHVFGIGTADSWHDKIVSGKFTGTNAKNANGGVSPSVDGGGGHFAQGTRSTVNGAAQDVVMEPSLTTGTRRRFTRLDYAALSDIGWQVPGSAAVTAVSAALPAASISSPPATITSVYKAVAFNNQQTDFILIP
jgi:hypothetical protein